MTNQPAVKLNPVRFPYPEKPHVVMDPSFQYWKRDQDGVIDELKIESWYAPKESPSGGHTCFVRLIYITHEGEAFRVKARAGGYGYCKFSSAFHSAFAKLFPQFKDERGLWAVNAAGETVVHNWLISIGFTKVVGIC